MERRVHAYMRVAFRHGRDVERVGPFLCSFTEHSDNPFLSYAIPDDGAAPAVSEIEALVGAYRSRERVPRLEYAEALCPLVTPNLKAAGFCEDLRTPLMICPAGGAPDLPAPHGIELVRLAAGDPAPLLFGAICAAHEAFAAFNDEPATPDDVERLRESMSAGSIAILAAGSSTREPAGSGVCTAPAGGLAEVGGIGVRPPFRRRGIAAAVTAALARAAFESGVTLAFLTPAGEAEARIYARAGFSPAGEIVHMSLKGGI